MSGRLGPLEPEVGAERIEARTRRRLYFWPSNCGQIAMRAGRPELCCVRWLTRLQFNALRAAYAAATPPAHLKLGRRCPGCGRGVKGRANATHCNGPCAKRLYRRRADAANRFEPEPPPPYDPWTLRPDLWRPSTVPEHLTPDALRMFMEAYRVYDGDDPDAPDSARFVRRPEWEEGYGAYARRMSTLDALERSPGGFLAPPVPPTTSPCTTCGGRWTASQWEAAQGNCTWGDCPSNATPRTLF